MSRCSGWKKDKQERSSHFSAVTSKTDVRWTVFAPNKTDSSRFGANTEGNVWEFIAAFFASRCFMLSLDRCVHKRPLGMDCIVYFIEGGISRCVLPSADAPHAPSADTEFHLEKSWLPEKNHACRTLSPTKDMKCHMLSAASGQTQCWQQHCWLFSEIWKERSAVEPVRPGRC